MKKLIVACALLVGPLALASPQTHHCKMPDGSMDMAKTKKQCHDAKGEWAKDAPAPAASPAPAKK